MLDIYSNLAIEKSWGISQYFNYLENLDLIKAKQISLRDLKAVNEDKFAIKSNSNNWQIASTVEEGLKNNVAIMPLNGVMQVEDGWCSEGMQSFSNRLYSYYANKDIKAIIIEGNTGGGESLAGQLVKSAVSDRNKPVIFNSHFLASAGLNASITADARFARGAQSQIGSIGTYSVLNKKRLEEYRANYEEIYSSKSPDKNLSWREYLNGKIELLVEELDMASQVFQDEVSANLPLNESLKSSTLSGRMFFANDALNRGLIDGIKSMKETFQFIDKIFN